MSWKGLQKAVSRLPHKILHKSSEATKDPEFAILQSEFTRFSKSIEQLQKDARMFRDSVSRMMLQQAQMTVHIKKIYDPNIGIEVPEGAIRKRVQQSPADAIEATGDAEAALHYCKDEVLKELDAVDTHVIRPLNDLEDIIKLIQKTIVKRDHKLLDFDRHTASLKKLKTKQERSFKEEKEIFRLNEQLETATADYTYLNSMLKEQLPEFFRLKAQLITPILCQFYFMQCRIYGQIYARCHELVHSNESYFMTHAMEIQDGFNWRKSQHDYQADVASLDLLNAKSWLAVSGGQNNSKLSLKDRAALREQEKTGGAPMSPSLGHYSPPPPYIDAGGAKPSGMQQQIGPSNPPMPASIANKKKLGCVRALYDYEAQAEGDLSFKRDEVIELIERTASEDDWWTGRLRGSTGIFPGNYVCDV